VANVGGNVSTLRRNRAKMGVNPEVIARRAKVCHLRYREHLSLRQIAARVGVHHEQVSHDLKALRASARKNLANEQQECQAVVVEELNAIAAAAWVAWEESRKPRVKTTFRFAGFTKGRHVKKSVTVEADDGDEPPEPAPPIPGVALKDKVVVRERRAGDNKFLAILCDVTRQRREFFGADADRGDRRTTEEIRIVLEPPPPQPQTMITGPVTIHQSHGHPPALTVDAPPDPPAVGPLRDRLDDADVRGIHTLMSPPPDAPSPVIDPAPEPQPEAAE
jgi:hypothetical protein